jgi:hypothetical protein
VSYITRVCQWPEVTGTGDTLARYFAQAPAWRITGLLREHILSITQTLSWTEWQKTVLQLIRRDFSEVLKDVSEQDVDWDAWRPLYEQGLSPRQAVAEAFLLPAA